MSKFDLFNNVDIKIIKAGPRLTGLWQVRMPNDDRYTRIRGDYIKSITIKGLSINAEGTIKISREAGFKNYFIFRTDFGVDIMGRKITVTIDNSSNQYLGASAAAFKYEIIETGNLNSRGDYAVLKRAK